MGHGVETSGFAEFDRFSAVFRRTRALLDAVLVSGDLPEGATEVLAGEALPHIEDVEAGFRVWLKAGEAQLTELRQLVMQAGLVVPPARDDAEARAALIEAMQALSGAGGEREILPASPRRLAALEHARLVFAFLPSTPPEEVHYPAGRRTYADIPSPRTPGELALRIEELERQLWWVAAGRSPRPSDPSYRRVYGFFDAAERLSSHGLHSGH